MKAIYSAILQISAIITAMIFFIILSELLDFTRINADIETIKEITQNIRNIMDSLMFAAVIVITIFAVGFALEFFINRIKKTFSKKRMNHWAQIFTEAYEANAELPIDDIDDSEYGMFSIKSVECLCQICKNILHYPKNFDDKNIPDEYKICCNCKETLITISDFKNAFRDIETINELLEFFVYHIGSTAIDAFERYIDNKDNFDKFFIQNGNEKLKCKDEG